MNIDEVITKIKKAIRLANKTTSEGERETAMRLARNLAERNGVAFEEVAEDAGESDSGRSVKEDDDIEQSKPSDSDLGHICYILKHHFGVIMMLSLRKGNSRRMKASWFGSHLNIDIARYVYHILVREGARAWREANKAAKAMEVDLDKAAFMRGFFWAICKKLEENPLRNDLDGAVRDAERKFLEYQEENGQVKMRPSGRNKKNLDVGSLVRGFDAGHDVNLARPCGANADDNRQPLGAGASTAPRLAV